MVNIPKPPNSTELQNLLRYRVDTDHRDRPVHDLPAGVHFKPRMKTNPYAAIKTVQGKTFTIGYFPNPELAHQAYTNYKE